MSVFIDTHTHLYDEQFDIDRAASVQRAMEAGVQRMYLPNCDSSTIESMLQMADQWPKHCLPMMGLHPCYVKENYLEELKIVQEYLTKGIFHAVGEIGLDFHWDTTFADQQKEALALQIDWALEQDLAIVIHTRKSMRDTIEIVGQKQNGRLRGIFHCFGGSLEDARKITDMGLHLGIGGIATFKKSHLPELLRQIPLEQIVLETDAPYLAPVPHRGKRNESAYIPLIADLIAMARQCPIEEVAEVTSRNANTIFKWTTI